MLEGVIAAGFYSCFYGTGRRAALAGAGAAGLALAGFCFPGIRFSVPVLTALWLMLTGSLFQTRRRDELLLSGGVWLLARSLGGTAAGQTGIWQLGAQQGGIFTTEMSYLEGGPIWEARLWQDSVWLTGTLQTVIAAAFFGMIALYLLGREGLYPLWLATLAVMWLLTGFLSSIPYAEPWQGQVMAAALYVALGGILVFQQIYCARQELERAKWNGRAAGYGMPAGRFGEVLHRFQAGIYRREGKTTGGLNLAENAEIVKKRQRIVFGLGGKGNRSGAAEKEPGRRVGLGESGNRGGATEEEPGRRVGMDGSGNRGGAAEEEPGRRAGLGGSRNCSRTAEKESGRSADLGGSRTWREAAAQEYQQLQIFEHDFRHHLDVIAALYEDGRPEEALVYMEDIKQARVSRQGRKPGGEKTLSYIMLAKREACRQAQISFSYQIVGSPKGIAQMDMATLLLNLLDNAIRACGEVSQPRSIGVMLLSRGELWEIEMVNSGQYEPEKAGQEQGTAEIGAVRGSSSGAETGVKTWSGSGIAGDTGMKTWSKSGTATDAGMKPRTASGTAMETGRKVHGIGLVSVRQIVEKYQGTYRIWQGAGQVRQKLILVQQSFRETLQEPGDTD